MPQQVPISADVKSAAVLAGGMALVAALTVPLLLPSVPPDQRALPLPLPIFCIVLAVFLLAIYGLFALAGLRMARMRGRDFAPLLTAIWIKKRPEPIGRQAASAFVSGLACGLLVVGVTAAIRRFFPQTFPDVLHPPSVGGALMASATASIGEEILCRLFLLSALLRLLPERHGNTVIAVAISSLLFGVLHAPAAAFLFGGAGHVPHLFWVWLIALNAVVGAACSLWCLRIGIGGAVLVHFGTDLVWHVLSQMF